MKKHLGAGLAAMALVAALSGCGGSPGTSTTTTAAAPAPTSAAPTESPTAAASADLKIASSSVGDVVVDGAGMSVYFFTKDVKDSGTSACTGACLDAWPPVLTTAATPSAEGVTGTLGTITTPEGTSHITLNGLPLYYFAQDKKPGDILGQGVNDVWYLADAAGDMNKSAPAG